MKNIRLEESEFMIIPKGIEHLPIAEKEAHIMLIEPKTTLNTGDTLNNLKKEILDKI